MLKNYLTTALRSFLRRKTHTIINVFGLTAGMTCTLLILYYVRFETSYDGFQKNRENLYRVNKVAYQNGEQNYKSAFTFSGQGPAMRSEIPEVKNYVRLLHAKGIVQYNNSKGEICSFNENDMYYADSSFFNLFSYRLKKGNINSVLVKPNSIVLSESTAKKYFGSEDPVGKTVRYVKEDFIVTGVFEDVPQNSHLAFSALLSFGSLWITDAGSWTNHSFYTYVLLRDKTNPAEIEPKLSSAFHKFIYKYWGDRVTNFWNLQRVDRIYLYSTDFTSISMDYGSYKTVLYLLLAGFLILIIAWINFINLSAARMGDRAKEIGIRKTAGASKSQLIKQFVTESLLINLIAAVLCTVIVQSILPLLYQFLGINVSSILPAHSWFWFECALLFLAGISITSVYPALWLSSINAAASIKRNITGSLGGNSLRKALITFQFAVSAVLMIVTFMIYKQISFTKNKDLGMNIEDVLIVRAPYLSDRDVPMRDFELFKHTVAADPSVRKASMSVSIPGGRFGTGNFGGIRREKSAPEGNIYFRTGRIDADFIELFGLKMLAGVNFSHESENRDAVILNKEAVRVLGYAGPAEAEGKYLEWNDRLFKIIGVTDNFHQESFHKTIEPIILYTNAFDQSINYFSLKLDKRNINNSLPFIEKTYKSIFPGLPFEYFFLDDFFNKQYSNDAKTGQLISAFAVLAVIIAAMGLFALASILASKRTKEIGIRKVVGASVFGIIFLLTKDFTKWVILANIIAWPAAYYFIDKWLQDFAYRIEISLWIFLLSGGIALLIALLTVSYQAIKAAIANPAEALRYE